MSHANEKGSEFKGVSLTQSDALILTWVFGSMDWDHVVKSGQTPIDSKGKADEFYQALNSLVSNLKLVNGKLFSNDSSPAPQKYNKSRLSEVDLDGLSGRLEQALLTSGLTKKDIERRLNVSYTAVQKWFKHGQISNSNLMLLSDALGADFVWLLTGVTVTVFNGGHVHVP